MARKVCAYRGREGGRGQGHFTGQFLVLAGELVLGFARFVQFVVETDDFGSLVAVVALGGVVQSGHFVQFALQVRVDTFQLLAAFLHVAGQRV